MLHSEIKWFRNMQKVTGAPKGKGPVFRKGFRYGPLPGRCSSSYALRRVIWLPARQHNVTVLATYALLHTISATLSETNSAARKPAR